MFKRRLYCDSTQISRQMLHGDCADVLNVLIKSATAAHVFQLIAPACGRVITQSAASLVSHMFTCLQQALMWPDTALEMQSGGKLLSPGASGDTARYRTGWAACTFGEVSVRHVWHP